MEFILGMMNHNIRDLDYPSKVEENASIAIQADKYDCVPPRKYELAYRLPTALISEP